MENVKHYFTDRSRVEIMGPDALRPENRIRYAYAVYAPDGRTVEQDYISGGVDQDFALAEAFMSWCAFVLHDADRYRGAMDRNELDQTHPEGVHIAASGGIHEWAYQHEDELQALELALSEGEDDEPAMTWDEAYERFDEMLNEGEPLRTGYASGQTEIRPSVALRKCDHTAYRTSFADWADAEGIDTDALEGEDSR